MSRSHRIRLQAAWESSADGTAWIRSFGRPTGVDAGDRIWLVIERPAAGAAVLNGRLLPPVIGGAAAWRYDVTAELRERNELRIEFGAPAAAAGRSARRPFPATLGAVALEIESSG